MRSLFIKVFLSFWLTVLVVGIAIGVSTAYYSDAFGTEKRALVSALLPVEATSAAIIFERSGRTALQEHVGGLERKRPVQIFFFGKGGREVLDRNPSSEVRTMAKALEGEDGLLIRGDRAGQRATGPSGQLYSLVLLLEPGDSFERSKRLPRNLLLGIEAAAIILVAGALFCYLIARDITAPLFLLRAAAGSIADGHLDTRVGPTLKHRHDEVAVLGHDFDRMAERIETLVAGQRRLLGDASHELRSPLSRLMLALSLVQRSPSQDASERLERIALETRRLDKLIGQLLTLSRIDSGVPHGVRAVLDFTNLVEEVVNDGDFEARAHDKRVAITAADACTVAGFEEPLRSAVENVVRNAIRHTPKGTRVEVSLQRREGTPVPRVVLRVRDHGTGVPEELLREIFLPFRRVSGSSKKAQPDGAGLGLAITERAVNAHCGQVRAMNAVEGGLIVEIELPVSQE